jgi:hypothetical protein
VTGRRLTKNEGRMNLKNSRATAVLGAALLIAPIAAVGGVAGSSGAGATTPTRVLTCNLKLATRPSAYLLSCADANASWTGVTWSAWNGSSASGHGILRQNDCTPNCVSGKFIDYRATVTLSKVVSTKKYGELFSEANFHYTVAGKAKSESFGLAD